jgi:hypothetical protein
VQTGVRVGKVVGERRLVVGSRLYELHAVEGTNIAEEFSDPSWSSELKWVWGHRECGIVRQDRYHSFEIALLKGADELFYDTRFVF